MNNVDISIDARDLALKAGESYRAALELTMGDAHAGLKYHLLRLSLLGLSEQDQKQLRELAELAFRDQDVAPSVDQINARKNASPLAVALADLIATAQHKRMAVLAAVFGAYVGLASGSESKVTNGISGAIAGVVAVTTNDFVLHQLDLTRFIEKK
jgi:hypothetical protein